MEKFIQPDGCVPRTDTHDAESCDSDCKQAAAKAFRETSVSVVEKIIIVVFQFSSTTLKAREVGRPNGFPLASASEM